MHLPTIYPIASIYDVWYIYLYIYHNITINVGKYAIFHGRYGSQGFSQGTWSITKPRFIKIPESKNLEHQSTGALLQQPEVALVSPIGF